MLLIAIVEQQELSQYAFKKLIDSLDIPEIKCTSLSSLQELRWFLQQSTDAFVILNPESYNMEQNKAEWLILSEEFEKSKWLLTFSNLNNSWVKDLVKPRYKNLSVVYKDDSIEQLKLALSQFLSKENYLSDQIQEAIKEQCQMVFKVQQVLTMVEREILREICFGKMNKEIALERHISIHTVVTHRKNIFKKLSVSSVYEATKYAIRSGIITVNDYYI